jgi:hypothetical protein
MYQALDFRIRGISPLLLHNIQLADPLNEWAKALKAISSKRKKTETDYEEMARIEWFGGLYVDEDNRPVFPGVNIEAAFIDAGKKQRLGEAFKSGLISDGNWRIEYDGPKNADDLWKNQRDKFSDRRAVVVGMARVFRTRPAFRKWELAFTVNFLPDILNKSQVTEAAATLGRLIGIGDYTPRHGRFEVLN